MNSTQINGLSKTLQSYLLICLPPYALGPLGTICVLAARRFCRGVYRVVLPECRSYMK